tara:strand:+ start:967 stop:1086 length:120 start_codon:yes stop_codon:yes gene_type:complete
MVQKLDGLDMVKSIVEIGLNTLTENQYMGCETELVLPSL